jgi:hypothetical protein
MYDTGRTGEKKPNQESEGAKGKGNNFALTGKGRRRHPVKSLENTLQI